jgi:hypothetical protein
MAGFEYCRVALRSNDAGKVHPWVSYGDNRDEKLEGLPLLEALNLPGQRGWELCWLHEPRAAAYMKRKLDGD